MIKVRAGEWIMSMRVLTIIDKQMRVYVCVGVKREIGLSRALGVSSFPSHPTAVGRTSAGLHAMLFSTSCSPLANPQ